MRIRAVLRVFAAALAGGVMLAATVSGISVNNTRIGGPMYDQIVLGKDLVADILPPPEYVLEAYLEATLAANRSKPLVESSDRLKQLHKDYDDRRQFWQGSGLDAALKAKLTVTSHEAVARFWEAVEGQLLPALSAGEKINADAAYGAVSSAYMDHRAVIDDIVADTDKLNKAIEAAAGWQINVTVWSIGAVIAALFALLAGCIVVLSRRLANPLVHLTAITSQIAQGDLAVAVPSTDRSDEIGEMAKAVQVFKDAGLEKLRLEGMTAEQRNAAEDERRRNEETQRQAATEQARVVEVLASGLRGLADGDLTVRLTDGSPTATSASATTSTPPSTACMRAFRRSPRRPARSPAPPARSPAAPPISRSAPKSSRRAWRRPRPPWSRSPRM